MKIGEGTTEEPVTLNVGRVVIVVVKHGGAGLVVGVVAGSKRGFRGIW